MRRFSLNSDFVYISAILLSGVLVYGHGLSHGFQMKWDDQWMVFNEYTETCSWRNVTAILTEFYRGQYSPLNQLIYHAIYCIWGYSPFAFHSASLVLHLGCGILVGSVIRCFSTKKIAWSVALLFVIHPLQVEVVEWISASKILVYAFFYLLALRLYIEYVKKNSPRYYIGALACFILSFGGKEQAVTLPVCLLLFDGIFKRDFKDGLLWREKIPFFLLAFFFAYITLSSHASRGVGLLMGQTGYPFYQRIGLGAYAYTEYMVKTFLPINLLFLYPFPMPMGAPLPVRFWLYPIGWAAAFVVFYKFWKKAPVFFGMAYYTVLISLTIQIIPMARAAVVADRYIYLAIPGLLFILVYYADQWIAKAGKWKRWCYGGVLVYFLLMGGYAHSRTYAWESNDALKGKLLNLLEQRRAAREALDKK